MNRLTNRVDAVGTTRFSYNASGLPEAEDGPWADDTVSYSYTQRRLTGLSLLRPSASAWTQSFGYDPAQRLTNLVMAAGTFGYAYEAGRPGLLNRQNLPGGSHVDYTYDPLARATNICYGFNSHRTLSRSAVVAACGFVPDCHRISHPNYRGLIVALRPGWLDSDCKRGFSDFPTLASYGWRGVPPSQIGVVELCVTNLVPIVLCPEVPSSRFEDLSQTAIVFRTHITEV